jgi:hypothetical protein
MDALLMKGKPKRPAPRIQWTIVDEPKRTQAGQMINEIQGSRQATEQTFDMATIWRKSVASIAEKYGERGLSVRFCMNEIAFKSPIAYTHQWMGLPSVEQQTATDTGDSVVRDNQTLSYDSSRPGTDGKTGYESDPGVGTSFSSRSHIRRATEEEVSFGGNMDHR